MGLGKRHGTVFAFLIAPPALAAPAYTVSSLIAQTAGRDVGLDISLPSADNPMGCVNAGLFRLLPSATNNNIVASVILSAQVQRKAISV